jgi:hypothetical protein
VDTVSLGRHLNVLVPECDEKFRSIHECCLLKKI